MLLCNAFNNEKMFFEIFLIPIAKQDFTRIVLLSFSFWGLGSGHRVKKVLGAKV